MINLIQNGRKSGYTHAFFVLRAYPITFQVRNPSSFMQAAPAAAFYTVDIYQTYPTQLRLNKIQNSNSFLRPPPPPPVRQGPPCDPPGDARFAGGERAGQVLRRVQGGLLQQPPGPGLRRTLPAGGVKGKVLSIRRAVHKVV